MKKINLSSPRYILPLICLPFILILFSVYLKQAKPASTPGEQTGDSLRSDLAGVSQQVLGEKLQDKLQAFEQKYRKSDGYSAVGALADEQAPSSLAVESYSAREKQMLDSIESSIRSRYSQGQGPGLSSQGNGRLSPGPAASTGVIEERAMRAALKAMDGTAQVPPKFSSGKTEDPMAVFKAQMAIVDSIGKANDPQFRARQLQEQRAAELKKTLGDKPKLKVSLSSAMGDGLNTVRPAPAEPAYIPAMVDQQLTVYVGSRIRMQLLEDIWVGQSAVKKGSYLYGTVSAFAAQRVQISITSVLCQQGILPVHLEVYDLDGLQGLYVPASAFREFTRELGTQSAQGISIDATGEQNKQLMSLAGRVFQSTSGAVTRLIRQNKAKISYSTRIYLIDPDQLSTIKNSLNPSTK